MYGTQIRRATNKAEIMIPRKYTPGDRVIGKRSPDSQPGVFVRAYVTLNNGWRNPAYVVKCDKDGNERVFQCLKPE